jgi:allantoinase
VVTVVRSRRVVLPDGERPATVVAREGRIVAIEPYDEPFNAADLGDVALLPGLVDTHVHVNEPGRTEWEGFATATRAAAAGGVTTIVDMPLNSIPPTVDVAALEAKRQAARDRVHVDVGFWGGAVPGNAGDLEALHAAGVFGFKAFLVDSGVPEFPPLDVMELAAAMRAVDALFVVHAEDPALVTVPPSG